MKTNQGLVRRVRQRKLAPIGLSSSDGARYLGISESMMRKMRELGDGPQYKKIGRKVIYLRKDLQEWIENK